jgi:cell division protein FtsB
MDHWPVNPRRVAVFIGILVLILMVLDFNARLETLNLLRKQEAIVSAQATQGMQTQAALQTQVAYASSDQVVHEWARSEGHYVQSGDQPVVPIQVPGEAPATVESATPLPTQMANWAAWWDLFFGE